MCAFRIALIEICVFWDGWGIFFFGRWVDFVAFDIVYEEKSSFFEYVFNTIILEICNTYYVSYIRDINFFNFNFVSIIFEIF